MIPWIDPDNPHFPPVEQALTEPDGLLCAGGNLSVDTLVAAYRSGIFPWYSEDQPILWWSPDPRMVLMPSTFHISRSLARVIKRSYTRVTVNQAFEKVITACAEIPRDDQGGTWITDEMMEAYCQFHQAGFAQSVEVWNESGALVGGLYGVAMGRVFFGESMFSRERDSSKLALAGLMASGCYDLVDCQVHTPHLERLGARLMPRKLFVKQVAQLIASPYPASPHSAQPLPQPMTLPEQVDLWLSRNS